MSTLLDWRDGFFEGHAGPVARDPRVRKFDPRQPRDWRGRWTEIGGGGGSESAIFGSGSDLATAARAERDATGMNGWPGMKVAAESVQPGDHTGWEEHVGKVLDRVPKKLWEAGGKVPVFFTEGITNPEDGQPRTFKGLFTPEVTVSNNPVKRVPMIQVALVGEFGGLSEDWLVHATTHEMAHAADSMSSITGESLRQPRLYLWTSYTDKSVAAPLVDSMKVVTDIRVNQAYHDPSGALDRVLEKWNYAGSYVTSAVPEHVESNIPARAEFMAETVAYYLSEPVVLRDSDELLGTKFVPAAEAWLRAKGLDSLIHKGAHEYLDYTVPEDWCGTPHLVPATL